MHHVTTEKGKSALSRSIIWYGANSDARNRIPGLMKRGWDITVIAPESEIKAVTHRFGPETRVVRFRALALNRQGQIARTISTMREIRQISHELIVCDLQGLRSCIAARMLRFTIAPVVIVILSPPVTTHLRRLRRIMFAVQLVFARAIGFKCTVLSEGSRDLIHRLSAGTFDAVVAPPGIDTDLFCPHGERISRSIIGIPEEATLLLYHGVLHQSRRLDLLFKGLAEAFESTKTLHLGIIGYGDDQRRLVEIADKLGLADRIHFLGEIPYDELPRYIRAADVSVVPLPDDQNWSIPYKMLEAMACGKPVIASRVRAVSDAVSEVDCVKYVEGGNGEWSKAVLDLIESPDELKRLSEKGLNHVVSRFTWDKSTDALESIFESCLNRDRT